MIVIVDYGLGNLRSISEKLKRHKILVQVTSNSEDIRLAKKIILPGVGNFRKGMENLRSLGIYDCLNDLILNHKIPIFGICLGMQLMTLHSEEGDCHGFGWIKSRTRKFDSNQINLPVPHIGWNKINFDNDDEIFKGVNQRYFYFLHSYYVKSQSNSICNTSYGIDFCSGFRKDNIVAFQFHPEKSHYTGFKLLLNFCTEK